MNSPEQERSLELARAGLQHAQSCITHVDTKVGVAVGLLVFLIPAPLVVINWLSGLGSDTSKPVFQAMANAPCPTAFTVLALLIGMALATVALFNGLESLSPRVSKGYDKEGDFHNEWKPNTLFPMYKPEKEQMAHQHFRKLHDGVDYAFLIGEYEHQLQQLGSILHGKVEKMRKCFAWLKLVMICYGVGLAFVFFIAVKGYYSDKQPPAHDRPAAKAHLHQFRSLCF